MSRSSTGASVGRVELVADELEFCNDSEPRLSCPAGRGFSFLVPRVPRAAGLSDPAWAVPIGTLPYLLRPSIQSGAGAGASSTIAAGRKSSSARAVPRREMPGRSGNAAPVIGTPWTACADGYEETWDGC